MTFESLQYKLKELWASPRMWAFAGALCTRGAGFIASFSLSRYAGPSVLALYISTVITMTAVTLPVAQVLFNAGLMASTRAPDVRWARRLLLVNFKIALVCLVPLLCVAMVMFGEMTTQLVHELDASWAGVLIGAVSAGGGQAVLFTLNGALNGLGAQLSAARLVAWTALGTMLLSYPVVRLWGLNGAWFVLTLNTMLPALLLWRLHHRFLRNEWQPASEGVFDASLSPWEVARAEVRRGAPQAGAVLATNIVGWFCSIYLVQEVLGVEAMAVLAVANQWLTLSLMPATSWGGLILKEMADLRLTEAGRKMIPRALTEQILRNLAVTVVVAGGVVLASPWLEIAYRLEGHGLSILMAASSLAALMMAVATVVQNAMVSIDRQLEWMICALLGLGGQLACTWFGVGHGAWWVQLGLLSSALISVSVCLSWAAKGRWYASR